MEPPDRNEANRLTFFQELQEEPWAFDFYQTLRRIECLHPTQPRLGKAPRPADEPIRLAQEPSLAFAPASFASCEADNEGLPPRLEQRILGLLGPNGPLPLHLTEHALNRMLHNGDKTFARFLDVFHHRMLLLFYRAWADAQPTVAADRADEDRFAFYLGALGGWSTSDAQVADAVPRAAKNYFAGHFARPQRNAEALASMLSEYFGLPASVEEFPVSWLALPEDQRSALGGPPREGIALGRGTVLGEHVCDVQSKFRIRLGPMDIERYESFLPSGEKLAVLVDWVRSWVGFEFEWEVVLVLQRAEVSGIQLGREGRLGWTSWLGAWRKGKDADDLALAPEHWQAAERPLALAA
jgi:type VI secretion system protein ImpH